jgi:hypothetical protein
VAGPSELDSARLRRDLSLALRRRLTTWAAIGATALTAVFSLIAATTVPGKAKTPTAPAATADPATTAPAVTTQNPFPTAPPVITPSLTPPTQAPQPGNDGPPVVITGGS